MREGLCNILGMGPITFNIAQINFAGDTIWGVGSQGAVTSKGVACRKTCRGPLGAHKERMLQSRISR